MEKEEVRLRGKSGRFSVREPFLRIYDDLEQWVGVWKARDKLKVREECV